MISRNGVCYDLNVSPYKCTINDVTFVFSSKLHLKKFKTKLNDNRKSINDSLTKRFNICVDVSTLADIVLYRKIESRGFLVYSEGKELCQNNIICHGVKVTLNQQKEQ